MTAQLLPAVPISTHRKIDIQTLRTVLTARHNQRYDVVVPTSTVLLSGGNLAVNGLDPVQVPDFVRPARIDEDGVHAEQVVPGFQFDPSGLYRPTHIVDQHLANLFDIPVRYIRKLRDQDVELLDINVNRWAAKATGSSLLRLLWGSSEHDAETNGVVRAILSDRYAIIDHLDTVVSILQGLRQTQRPDGSFLDGSNITQIDLSEEKLYLEIEVPEIAVHARSLVENYRSPFTGQTGAELPLVHAGIKITNSEIGRGAFAIKPFAKFEVCANGATIDGFGIHKVHLGKVLEQGSVKWSNETLAAANELVRNQTADAVGQFLSTDFLSAAVDRWEQAAGVEVKSVKETFEVIAKELSYTEAEQDDIFGAFIKGGDTSAFAVGHAVTAASQNIADPDRAHELAESHFAAVQIAAREAQKS